MLRDQFSFALRIVEAVLLAHTLFSVDIHHIHASSAISLWCQSGGNRHINQTYGLQDSFTAFNVSEAMWTDECCYPLIKRNNKKNNLVCLQSPVEFSQGGKKKGTQIVLKIK